MMIEAAPRSRGGVLNAGGTDGVLDNRLSAVVKLTATRNQYILYRVESTEDPRFWTRSLERES